MLVICQNQVGAYSNCENPVISCEDVRGQNPKQSTFAGLTYSGQQNLES
jgi:hypothetical protein